MRHLHPRRQEGMGQCLPRQEATVVRQQVAFQPAWGQMGEASRQGMREGGSSNRKSWRCGEGLHSQRRLQQDPKQPWQNSTGVHHAPNLACITLSGWHCRPLPHRICQRRNQCFHLRRPNSCCCCCCACSACAALPLLALPLPPLLLGCSSAKLAFILMPAGVGHEWAWTARSGPQASTGVGTGSGRHRRK